MALLWMGALLALLLLHPRGGIADSYAVATQTAGISGVNLDASELAGDRLVRTLAELDAGGIRWVRFTLRWDQIEPARGRFDWNAWDAVFSELARHPALEPLVVLDGSPAWARAAAEIDNPQAPPHERADFGAFAAAASRRYGNRVRYYQVWHEPNIAPHWGVGPADPAGYLGLLREAAAQIRAADADAQIVLAALAPTTESGGANLSDIAYLDALYALGARAWFDIAAAQPYGFSQPPDAPAQPSALNFGRATLLRQVMVRHGDAATPLWATAFGWNVVEGSPWGSVGAADQGAYAGRALAMARTAQPWLGPLFWAAFCPQRPAGDPWLGFSVCAAGGSPRPVWGALTAAAAAPSVLPPGQHPVSHPALRYGPGWRVTPSAADPGKDGDALDFAFSGTGLALRVQGGPYWAFYRITVDGAAANALPRDESGAAYLVLHDPLAETRWVTVARALPPGEHRVHLEATGGWGQWALQGVAVTAGTAPPAWIAWVLLALAVLATAVWAFLAWPLRRAAAGWLRARLDAAAAWPGGLLWGAAAALALLLILSGRPVVDLAALAGLGLVFLVRPDLSLPFVAASLPFWQCPERLVRWDFAHFEIFLWLGALALAARLILRWQSPASGPQPPRSADRVSICDLRFASLDWPVLALLLSGLLSTLFAQGQGVAWREFRIVFLGGALFYWLITRTPWPGGRRFSPMPLLNGLLAGMVAVSLIGLWQLATGQGRVDVEGVWRVRALYGSPNNLALVLDRAIPLALALAAFGTKALTPTPPPRPQEQGALSEQFSMPSSAPRPMKTGTRTTRIPRTTRTGLVFIRVVRVVCVVRVLFAGQFLMLRAALRRVETPPCPPNLGGKLLTPPAVGGLGGPFAGGHDHMPSPFKMSFLHVAAGTGRLFSGQMSVPGLPGNTAPERVIARRAIARLRGTKQSNLGHAPGIASPKVRPPAMTQGRLLLGRESGEWRGLRLLYALAAAIMTVACVATFSKGALLLGLPAGIGLVLVAGARRSGRRWPLRVLGGIVVIAAVGLVLLFRTPRFADLFNFGSGTSFVRIKLWLGAEQMALAHPVLGVGPDNFLYAYRTRYVLPGAWTELNLSHPHNLLLDLWTRLGLIGVLAGGWVLVAGWVYGWRLFIGREVEPAGGSSRLSLHSERDHDLAHRARPARRPGRDL